MQIAEQWENLGRKNKNLGGEKMEDKTKLQDEVEFLLSGRGKYLVARALVLLEKELESITIDWLKEPSDLADVRFLLNGELLLASAGAVHVAESFRTKNLDKWLKN